MGDQNEVSTEPIAETHPNTEISNASYPAQRPTQGQRISGDPRPSRRIYIVQSIDPCCMPLVNAVIIIAIMEIILYCIGCIYYTLFIFRLNASSNEDIKSYWGNKEFYSEREKNNITPEQTTNYIKSIAIAEDVVSFLYILVSVILIIGAVKRVAFVAYFWILSILCLSISRLVLLILAPIPIFQFGLIWVLFEIYSMFVVYRFYYEMKAYPDGVDYAYANQYQVGMPMVEPIYNSTVYSYPATGYQLVPMNQRTIYMQTNIPINPNAKIRTENKDPLIQKNSDSSGIVS